MLIVKLTECVQNSDLKRLMSSKESEIAKLQDALITLQDELTAAESVDSAAIVAKELAKKVSELSITLLHLTAGQLCRQRASGLETLISCWSASPCFPESQPEFVT